MPDTPDEMIAVYADESCLGNGRDGDNAGGAGGLVEWKSPATGQIVRWDYWVSEPATTNNRMALRSVIEAFRGISARNKRFAVVFTTDSRYIVDGMTSWVHGWARQGWKRKSGPIENLELWKEALSALGSPHCEWRSVRGHNGQPPHAYVNYLATRAAAAQDSSGGLIASGFDSWMAENTGTGVTRQSVAPFPDHETFTGRHREWTI
jgi:ribonuclease HI